MKWWLQALIASILWIAFCIGGAFLLFPAQTTPEQDSKLSEILGEAMGFGVGMLWVLFAWKAGKFPWNKPKVG